MNNKGAKLIKNFNKLVTAIERGKSGALRQVSNKIIAEAVKVTPRDNRDIAKLNDKGERQYYKSGILKTRKAAGGNLRGSFVAEKQLDGSYAVINNAHYAAFVHDAEGTINWTTPGTDRGFITRTADKYGKDLQVIFENQMRKILKI